MSYEIELTDPITGDVLEADAPHQMKGGTFIHGGSPRLELNVTQNYSPYFSRTLGEKGIRGLYGMTGAETIPIMEQAIGQLGDDVDDEDYWNATEGNAKRALLMLLAMARMRPDGVWRGD